MMDDSPGLPVGELFRWAVASHEYDSAGLSTAEYARRLAICETCPLHRAGRCLICGCALVERAKNPAADCPHYLNHWPNVLDLGHAGEGKSGLVL
jgi:hypothetical protein